jgi:hypothetical protein
MDEYKLIETIKNGEGPYVEFKEQYRSLRPNQKGMPPAASSQKSKFRIRKLKIQNTHNKRDCWLSDILKTKSLLFINFRKTIILLIPKQ